MWALRSHPSYGKGFAVRTGMLAATGELLAFTDADGTYGPGDLERVVQALAEVPVRAQARSGSRLRVLADGRRMLGEIWSVRRDLDSDHRSRKRPLRAFELRRPAVLGWRVCRQVISMRVSATYLGGRQP